jgi:hypothetical protein
MKNYVGELKVKKTVKCACCGRSVVKSTKYKITLAEAQNLQNGDIVYNSNANNYFFNREFFVQNVAQYEGFENKIGLINDEYRANITFKHFIKNYSLTKI